ncbi:MAG: DUF4040 domain-containing protein [Candidatus Omnitrophica bacterium]|nr:DUF4040 domain-containing protein [Candidatus Omnitrophota bacterium]MBU1869322.1 DUF4040 domain-containing protein [Candidatus Omnitrophota bacterium]
MEIHLILIFMIIFALAAIEIKDLLSSVVAMSAVGLGLCFAFLILKAPNLAITQLVVELLCLILLIRATINKDLPLVKDGRWFFNTISTFVFVAVFLSFIYFALKELPRFGEPLMRLSQQYFDRTAVGNTVNAITVNFRHLDALAEIAVLFAAIIGVLAVMRKVGRIHEE